MKKMATSLLSVLFLILTFSSCNTNNNQSEPNSKNSASVASVPNSESGDTSKTEAPNIIKKDFGGKEFIFYTTWSKENYNSEILKNTFDGDSNEFMTTAVNEAIEKRNNLAEEYLNIKIKEVHSFSSRVGGTALKDIRDSALTGEPVFLACTPSIYDCGTLASEDAFVDLNTIKSFHSENPWWDQSFNKELTINGKLYFTLGDIGLLNKNATPVVFFNKKIASSLGLNNIYDLVKNGDWTFDEAYRMAKMCSEDLDQNGIIDYKDKVGWAGQNDDSWNFFYASGEKIVQSASDGTLRLSMYNQRSAKVIEKMNKLFHDKNHYITANNYFKDSSYPSEELTGQAFIDGRILFFSDNMSFIHRFSDMTDDFGLLPVPKLDSEQEKYYSLINAWTGNAFAIPSILTAEDAEFAAICLDVMGYFSVDTVSKEYDERTLKYQKTRDEESIEMLNLIYGSRGCDVGFIYNIGSNGNQSNETSLPWLLHKLMTTDANTFASLYETCENIAKTDLQNLIALYSK